MIRYKKRSIKIFVRYILLLTVAIILAILGGYLYFLNRFDLQVIRFNVVLPTGYERLDGIKIVLFSDIHMLDSAKDLSNLKKCIKAINSEKPDIILFAGDLIATENMEWRLSPARIISRLRTLKSQYGVYAVTGNHDWYDDEGKNLVRCLTKVGISVLDNTSVTIPGKCNIVGVQDECGNSGPRPDEAMRNTDSALPTIALMHRPEYWELFPETVKLFFAGHTHGGQINLPLLKHLLLKQNGSEEYPENHYYLPGAKGRRLFISYGIGTSGFRVRVNCPSDILIFNLQIKKHEKDSK